MLAVGWLEVKLPGGNRRLPPRDDGRAQSDPRGVLERRRQARRDDRPTTSCGGCGSKSRTWGWDRGSIRRSASSARAAAPPARHVIQRGDLLHTDFGLVYLGFSTDTQHHAYVLKPGETDAPAGHQGRTRGRQPAAGPDDAAREARRDGQPGAQRRARSGARGRLTPSIYCHPVGYHGHGAGPPIGMTDYQTACRSAATTSSAPDTWHSIELNVMHRCRSGTTSRCASRWKRTPRCSTGWDWIDGRQTTFYLIK